MRASASGAMPMPVSFTSNSTVTCSAVSPSLLARTSTSPRSVNFTALAVRLTRTCRSRNESPRSPGGISGSMRQASSMPLVCARSASKSTAPSTVSRRLKSMASSASLPASIFEKSRMSLMMSSSDSVLLRIVSTYSRCSCVSRVSVSRPVMPVMAFIGVRISWLMFARNCALVFADSSAASRAFSRSCSACLRAVTSSTMPS